jgi:TRAP-type C4-dicarboxylate transport system substrate-binding protein
MPFPFLPALLALFGSAVSMAAEPGGMLRLGVPDGGNSFPRRAAEVIAERIADAAGGARVTIADGGNQAGSGVWRPLQDGRLEVGVVSAAEIASRFPGFAALNTPFVFADLDAAERFYFGEGGARVAALAARRDVTVAAWFGADAPFLLSRVPLESVESVKGLRAAFDSASPAVEIFRSLGAEASVRPYRDRLAAFVDGIYDVVELDPSGLAEGELPPEGIHAYHSGYVFPFWAICFSGAAAKMAPEATLSALVQGARAGAAAAEAVLGEASAAAYAVLSRRGASFNALNADLFAAAAGPAADSAVATADAVVLEEINKIKTIKNQDDTE